MYHIGYALTILNENVICVQLKFVVLITASFLFVFVQSEVKLLHVYFAVLLASHIELPHRFIADLLFFLLLLLLLLLKSSI